MTSSISTPSAINGLTSSPSTSPSLPFALCPDLMSPSTPLPSPPSGVTIRLITSKDISSLALCGYASYVAFNASVSLSPEFSSLSMYRQIVNDSYTLQLDKRAAYYIMTQTKSDCDNESEFDVLGSGCIYHFGSVTESSTIGMISISNNNQRGGLGKLLMKYLISHALKHFRTKSIRLVQIGPNIRSYSLYAGMGFVSREMMTNFEGYFNESTSKYIRESIVSRKWVIRDMVREDISVCDNLFVSANGISRLKQIEWVFNSQYEKESELSGFKRCLVVEGEGKDKEIIGFTMGYDGGGFSLAKDEMALYGMYEKASREQKGREEKEATISPAEEKAKQKSDDATAVLCHDDSFYTNLSTRYDFTRVLHPPIGSLDFHVCSIRNPQVTQFLINGGLRASRQMVLMSLGEYENTKDGFIYFPSIEW